MISLSREIMMSPFITPSWVTEVEKRAGYSDAFTTAAVSDMVSTGMKEMAVNTNMEKMMLMRGPERKMMNRTKGFEVK